jgi:hypothetical protein
MLIRISESHHPARTARPHNINSSRLEPGFNGFGCGERHGLAIIHDESDAGQGIAADQ